MTRADIKAELRRSACEDAEPWSDVALSAFDRSWGYKEIGYDELVCFDDMQWRVFFLLVAEAL